MKLLFELSGENPTLPAAELECVGEITDQRAQVAVVMCHDLSTIHRLAMTHVVLEYLGECNPDTGSFKELLKSLSINTDQTFAGRVKKIHTGNNRLVQSCSQLDFEKIIGTSINGPVSLNNPEVQYRAILSEDRCYFGKVLFSIDRQIYNSRNPGKRIFFHPGVMMPRMARTLVNISLAKKGDLLLDPFCGTGGLLIEAGMLGINTIGCDFDPMMINGCQINAPDASLLIADTMNLPFKNNSIDAIVTDFPYGQSVCIKKTDTIDSLYDESIAQICRVIKFGKRIVIVTHTDIREIAARHMTVLQYHEQRVHKSLTRRILVLIK